MQLEGENDEMTDKGSKSITTFECKSHESDSRVIQKAGPKSEYKKLEVSSEVSGRERYTK